MKRDPRPSPKIEALASVAHGLKMLDDPEPLDGLRRSLLRGVLEHIQGRVEVIQEIKRPRKEKAA